MQRVTVQTLFLVVAIVCSTGRATAENIGVEPPGWDFGVVDVGNSVSVDIVLTSLGPTPLTIHGVEIPIESTGIFTVSGSTGPAILLPDEFVTIVVTFTPADLGLYETFVNVSSDATSPDNELDLPLRGIGGIATAASTPPAFLLLIPGLAGLVVSGRRLRRRKCSIGLG